MKNPVSAYNPCFLCPRRCGADRGQSPGGYCGESAALRIASASIHRGEEPPLTGEGPLHSGGGSGTIFVSGCNLGCLFCQNHQIRRAPAHPGQAGMGRPVDTEEFARICLALQEKGAENINIVTGSHAVPALVRGIEAARNRALAIPVLWNSSAYEIPGTLDLLTDTVDVYLPDMKTLDSALAKRCFNAPDYPEIAAAAIKKMIAMRPVKFEERENGPARLVSGVMVRHLVLPGETESTRRVLRWFAEHCSGRAIFSLMFQYTPVQAAGPEGFGAIPDCYCTKAEYHAVMEWLGEFGLEDGFCQELSPGNDWLPDFGRTNPFPSELSIPVWHWKEGFVEMRLPALPDGVSGERCVF